MRMRCWLAVLFGVWSLAAAAGDSQVRGLMVDDRLPAGNIVFEKAEGDTVYVRQDVRDTKGSWSWGWFYWGMRVRGAAGRTLTFKFTHGDVVGARGPVVSLDRGRTFAYPLDGRTTKTGFTYTFADDADEGWFYECHPYVRADWDAFVAAHKAELGTAFVVETLCRSRRGADVPRARFGCIAREPCYRILMTARHHCSETMASWVLEGVAEAFLKDDDLGRWLRDNVELMMVPMVDYDGVQAGDQGKNRVPHDHNRDYTEFIYPETKAITGWIASHAGNRLDAFIDVHCPFIRGDDHLYTPWKDPKLPYMNPGNERRFSRLLEQMQCGSMRYKASDDLLFGREWNKGINYDQGWSALIWALNRISTLRVARSYEVPFANANGAVVTPETCRDLGRDTAKVFRAFFADGGVSAGKESADGLALASNDFVRCCRRMTGAREPSARFAVDPSLDAVHDEYRIVSEGDGLAFLGANLRAVQYAVYDYLARQGCRFYWDGESIPSRTTLEMSGLDIREKSHFAYRAIRYFAHRGLTRFQAEHWGLADWKREIDYLVRNRVNTFMLRIGQDDLFQKAFPDICPYPDPAKPCPESEGLDGGYNDRSLFWPLQYRGELRKKVLAYARARGLMAPEDFGTMSHWYSRTPYAFLDRMKPDFLPQEGGWYGHPTDRVWDIRQPKWLDAYWKLTQASIDNYGRPDLLHTIGIAERHCFTNRAENLKMKVDLLNLMVRNAKAHYPDSQILFAGWDFYNGWKADEVGELLKTLDPKDVLIWDYEADAHDKTNFTEWDIVGKFPYTFGIFENLVQGLDIRMDYARIRERQRIVRADPMCRGYLFWSESSHADILGLDYFTRNAWKADADDVDVLVADLCRGRYGDQAAAMESVWRDVLPVSTNCCDTWRDNAARASIRYCLNPRTMEGLDVRSVDTATLSAVPDILRKLSGIRWEGDFIRRDTIDLARTAADRLMLSLMGEPRKNAAKVARLMSAFTDLLALHTDYSLAESYDRLAAIHPIAYPRFGATLLQNAVNGYCASHHYEAFAGLYAPWWRELAATGRRPNRQTCEAFFTRDLQSMRPTLPRTPENYRRILSELAEAAEEVFR